MFVLSLRLLYLASFIYVSLYMMFCFGPNYDLALFSQVSKETLPVILIFN